MVDAQYRGSGNWQLGDSQFFFKKINRGEGQVINKLFKSALISFHGAVWAVNEYPELTQIPISQNEWNLLREKILDAVEPHKRKAYLLFPEDLNEIKVLNPSVIKLKIHEKMKFFRCSRNGHIVPRETIDEIARCPVCGDTNMVQLPIFIKKYTNFFAMDSELRATDPHSIYSNIESQQIPNDSKIKCPTCGQERQLMQKSAYRPIESLTWICKNCQTETILSRPFGSRNYYYKIDSPYDSLFRGLIARQSTALDNIPLENEKKILSLETNFIKDINFSNQVNVVDANYGNLSNKKFFYFESNNGERIIYARKFSTKGIVFDFSDDVFRESMKIIQENLDYISNDDAKEKLRLLLKDEKLFKITLLHTFKHIMLFPLPLIIGIEASKVSGDYNYQSSPSVVLFDNEAGGIGVFESIKDDFSRFAYWLDQAKKRVSSCNRDPHCNGACKLCSFLENCGNINQNLNRYLLFPIFKIDFKTAFI